MRTLRSTSASAPARASASLPAVSPMPSWLLRPMPQAHSAPSDVSTTVCSRPAGLAPIKLPRQLRRQPLFLHFAVAQLTAGSVAPCKDDPCRRHRPQVIFASGRKDDRGPDPLHLHRHVFVVSAAQAQLAASSAARSKVKTSLGHHQRVAAPARHHQHQRAPECRPPQPCRRVPDGPIAVPDVLYNAGER